MLFAFQDLWKEMGRLQFSDPYTTASSTTGGWSRCNILMCFIYIYIILSTSLSFLDLTDAIFFLQGLPFLYTFPFLQVHFACVFAIGIVFNVNLTDSFDDRRSQCRLI